MHVVEFNNFDFKTDDTFVNCRSFLVKICVLFACIPSCFHTKNWGYIVPYQAQFRVSYFDYFWLLQENGRSKQSHPITGFKHGVFTVVVGYPNHYAMDDHIFPNVKLIQYKIEHFSLKPLQMGRLEKKNF
jgi:hypothetical protein